MKTVGQLDDDFWYDMLRLPLEIVQELDLEICNHAAYFKTKYKISLADSFALATAKIRGGFMVTSDHHEFDVIEKEEIIDFVWIR